MNRLYVVATPIGNLSDITLRALQVLKTVDYIIAEDTRSIRRLLSHHGISAPPLIKYTEYDAKRIPAILETIRGKSAALTVDAGTPGISDPGADLIRASREAGFKIYALPGPSAFVAALSIAGLRSNKFEFVGFLPKKRGELERLFRESSSRKIPLVSYESPHRIVKTLKFIAELFPDLHIFCAKELTKIHEESRWGKASELLQWLSQPSKTRGEFVLIFDFSRD
jgi:16S rRNA (cytidine1402-2'-O)-methyltransferase